MKIRGLISSNSPHVGSGYGTQVKGAIHRWKALDCVEDFAVLAFAGVWGGGLELNGVRIYPAGDEPYSNDVIGDYSRDFRANVVITLIDAWVLKDVYKNVKPALFLPWFPIDTDPIPPAVLAGLEGAWRPLVYTKWGSSLMSRNGWHHRYIPHGVDTKIFHPLGDDARLRFRKEAGIPPDAFLAVMVAANQDPFDRKAFEPQFRAFAQALSACPDLWLYCHTDQTAKRGGFDLAQLARTLGISERVKFPSTWQLRKGFPQEFVASAYNAGDVFLGASRYEGFYLGLVEAQACGCPVVTSNFGPMAELVRWGQAVEPLDFQYHASDTYYVVPDADGITAAIIQARAEKARPDWEHLRRLTFRQIQAEYDWDHVVETGWKPLFEEICQQMDTPKAPPLRSWKEKLRASPENLAGNAVGTRLSSAGLEGARNGTQEDQRVSTSVVE